MPRTGLALADTRRIAPKDEQAAQQLEHHTTAKSTRAQ